MVGIAAVAVVILPCSLYVASAYTAARYEAARRAVANASSVKSLSFCSNYNRTSIRSRVIHSDLPFVDMDEITPYRRVPPSKNAIFCVYQNDVLLKYPKLRYRINDIPGTYCTHLLYYKAGVTSDGSLYSKNPVIDETYRGYKMASELKNIYPHLKVLLAVGGGPHLEDTVRFSHMSSNLNRTRAFADRAYWWLVNQAFDGLHIDWRYPGGDCGKPSDKKNYLRLVETLRERFGSRFLITVGVPHQNEVRHRGYHLPGLADNVNYLLVSTHELTNTSSGRTRCPGPYTEQPRLGTTVYEVVHTLKHEIPREHRDILCFSVSLRGVSWTLRSSSEFAVGSLAQSAGSPTGNTQEAGLMEYTHVCRFYLRDIVDRFGLCSFAVHARNWVSYEGTRTIAVKLARMRKDMGTGGLCMAVWNLEMDDFGAECDSVRAPLLRAIYDALSS
ncbi:chitinase-like protein 4 [Ornithodoros turicata]|uniref:chitinase-like protein 4 n=1 Tax=Ornithodoros turicata TaxID=34597 RepID=UPI003139D8CD